MGGQLQWFASPTFRITVKPRDLRYFERFTKTIKSFGFYNRGWSEHCITMQDPHFTTISPHRISGYTTEEAGK